MNHISEGLKKADDKLGTVVDGGKAEVDIGKEESKIYDNTKAIGKKIIEYLDNGNTVEDESIMELYKAIVESRDKIADLKAKQEEYKKKL